MNSLIKILAGTVITLLSMSSAAQETTPTEAETKILLERLTGTKVSADDPRLNQMLNLTKAGDWQGAAQVATNDPNFINVTIKQMAQKMSTREESIQTGLNDFTAFFMGVVRDDTDARKLLTGDFSYLADLTKVPADVTVRSDLSLDLVQSNNHYADIDNLKVDLNAVLYKEPGQMLLQSSTNTLVYNPDPAGLLTTRAFMGAHAIAGTNRRPVEFTFRQFMCVKMDEWADTTASDARIGRDIDRFPGGDHTKFQVSCKGCHTGMDGFRGAFAKWNMDNNRLVQFDAMASNSVNGFSNGVVQKMNGNNGVFPAGFVTKDSSFVNNSRGPANEVLFGWRGPADQGYGVKDFGNIVANSARFSECMVKRVYEATCRREIVIKDRLPFIKYQASRFESEGYNLKKLFQSVALSKECGQ